MDAKKSKPEEMLDETKPVGVYFEGKERFPAQDGKIFDPATKKLVRNLNKVKPDGDNIDSQNVNRQ